MVEQLPSKTWQQCEKRWLVVCGSGASGSGGIGNSSGGDNE